MPAITTVSQCMFETGKGAISCLLANNPGGAGIIINSRLIIRDSCGCRVHGSKNRYTCRTNGTADTKTGPGPDKSEPPGSDTASPRQNLLSQKKVLVKLFLDTITVMNSIKVLNTVNALEEWLVRNMPYYGIESACVFHNQVKYISF